MFKNLRIVCVPNEKNISVNVAWEWAYEEGPLPSCNLFCCTVPENQLLQDSLFSQEEIINWINANMIDVLTPETRISNIEAFHMNPVNKSRCQYNSYSLAAGGRIYENRLLTFPVSDLNKVFLVCLMDAEGTFEYNVFAPDLGKKINFTVEDVYRSMLDKLFKRASARKLIFDDEGYKRRVMVTEFAGDKVYTVLPDGTEYIVDERFNPEEIKDVVYLSTLIGS